MQYKIGNVLMIWTVCMALISQYVLCKSTGKIYPGVNCPQHPLRQFWTPAGCRVCTDCIGQGLIRIQKCGLDYDEICKDRCLNADDIFNSITRRCDKRDIENKNTVENSTTKNPKPSSTGPEKRNPVNIDSVPKEQVKRQDGLVALQSHKISSVYIVSGLVVFIVVTVLTIILVWKAKRSNKIPPRVQERDPMIITTHSTESQTDRPLPQAPESLAVDPSTQLAGNEYPPDDVLREKNNDVNPYVSI